MLNRFSYLIVQYTIQVLKNLLSYKQLQEFCNYITSHQNFKQFTETMKLNVKSSLLKENNIGSPDMIAIFSSGPSTCHRPIVWNWRFN